MADIVTGTLQALLKWNQTEALDLSSVDDVASINFTVSLANGTGDNQVNELWHDSRSLSAASNDDLDLTALTRTIFGTSVTSSFSILKAILIHNTSTTDGDDLYIDSSVSNSIVTPFNASATSKIEIPASSPLVLANVLSGWAVTSGTADILRITNDGAGSVDYKIALLGLA